MLSKHLDFFFPFSFFFFSVLDWCCLTIERLTSYITVLPLSSGVVLVLFCFIFPRKVAFITSISPIILASFFSTQVGGKLKKSSIFSITAVATVEDFLLQLYEKVHSLSLYIHIFIFIHIHVYVPLGASVRILRRHRCKSHPYSNDGWPFF